MALALGGCLSGCLGPSLVPPLCVCVGDGRRCPLGLGKGSRSIEGSWKLGGVRDLRAVCVCASEGPSLQVPVPRCKDRPRLLPGDCPVSRRGCVRGSVNRSPLGLWGLSSLGAAVVLTPGSSVPGGTCCSYARVRSDPRRVWPLQQLVRSPPGCTVVLVVSGSEGYPTPTSLGGPDFCPISRAVSAPREPACGRGGGVFVRPPRLSEGPKKLVASGRSPPRARPTLPGHACRGCERPLPDPEVDHAQAEKEVAQAAPRFPVHSPRWPPGPRAGLC